MIQIIWRSWCSDDIATFQPPLSGPSRFSAGTSTSSRKTSQNVSSEIDAIRMGSIRTPGDCRSRIRQEMPRCLGASGIGAGIQGAPPRQVGLGGPDLVAVDPEHVPVPYRAGAQAGEVGPGFRFGHAKRPPLVTAQQRNEQTVDLLGRAELTDAGCGDAGTRRCWAAWARTAARPRSGLPWRHASPVTGRHARGARSAAAIRPRTPHAGNRAAIGVSQRYCR